MNFDNLVAVLAVAVAVPLILSTMPKVPIPGPVLEIIAGIVLGPAVLNLVKPDQAVRLVSMTAERAAATGARETPQAVAAAAAAVRPSVTVGRMPSWRGPWRAWGSV